MKEKIKRLGWFIAGFLFMMGTHVMAAGNGAVVTDHYHEVVYLEPYSVEVCGEEQIVIGSQADVVNGAIWGAIFGAVIGDAIDDDGGRIPGAVIGALIGSDSAQSQGVVTTTAMVCRQETRQQKTVRKEYKHSKIKFEYEGFYYDLTFIKR